MRAAPPHLIALLLAITLPLCAFAAERTSEQPKSDSALAIPPGPAPDLVAQSDGLTQQAMTFYQQGRYAEAEPLLQKALAIREKAFGLDHPEAAAGLNNLAGVYREEGRYGEAEALYRHALVIREKQLGPNNPALAANLNNLAAVFSNQGRYYDAELLFRRALDLKEKGSGPDDPDLARALNNLAQLYRLQGRYAQAEPLCRRALAVLKKALGPDHPDVATVLNNLAQLYAAQARYPDAEPLYVRALALREDAFGSEHPVVAGSLNNLAEFYRVQNRYGEAEPLYQRALAIRESALGPDHPDVAVSLHDMAALYVARGRYDEAEPLYRRALSIREKALAPDHPDIAASLAKLAALYQAQGREDEVEPLLRRALAIREKVFGRDHPDVAKSLNNLAFFYDAQGRYGEAEPLFRQALTVTEERLGPDNPDLAVNLNNMAVVLSHEARYSEAEQLYRRALALEEQALGPDHPDLARTLNNLAAVSRAQGRNFLAEPLYRRALAIREKALGPDDPAVAASLNNLAELYRAESRLDPALAASARAVDILQKHLVAGLSPSSAGGPAEQRRDRAYLGNYIGIAYAAAAGRPQQKRAAAEATFRVAQLVRIWQTARTAAVFAAGFAAGADPLAAAARQRRDLAGVRQQLDADIIGAAGRPSAERNLSREQALRAAAQDVAERLDALDARIATEFSSYAELTNPQTVSAETAQRLLGGDEALLVYLSAADEAWLWVLRRDAIAFYRLAIGAQALAAEVTALRARLDPRRNPNLEPYPAARGYGLYEKILAPAAPLLAGVHHLLIVPDGALQSLPPGVLVANPPQRDPENLEDHRNIAWLAREYAITVLPAVSSLGALRQSSAPSTASAGFLGIGDPVLQGSASGVRLANLNGLKRVDPADKFPVMPQTADELRAIGNLPGAPDNDLLLGGRASGVMLRRMPLERYKIIEFAIPALISSKPEAMAEPALLLTPSAGGEPEDDGLLTASKIAALKLNADWVVLSACDTAAADGSPGAEGLFALDKAFFYAGARGLLVSHWRASSAGAVRLTSGAFAEFAKEPAIGRAEALRRAKATMLDASSPIEFAHPAAWAAFELVGEGGTER